MPTQVPTRNLSKPSRNFNPPPGEGRVGLLLSLSLSLSFFLLLFSACASKPQQAEEAPSPQALQWETQSLKDSTALGQVDLKVTLPLSGDSVAQLIRDSLIAVVERNITHFYMDEDNNPVVEPYKGDKDDLKALIDYYGKSLMAYINKENKAMLEEQLSYMRQDSTITPQQIEEARETHAPWAYSLDLSLQSCDSTFITLNDNEYGYYGGAHGGVMGDGTIVFLAANGHRLRGIVRPDAVKALQPLMKKGLKEYFSQNGEKVTTDSQLKDCLMLPDDTGIIPLPSHYEPYPSEEGIVFTYAQYEIACYAAGMPSFTIPYAAIKPYLSEAFLSLLK